MGFFSNLIEKTGNALKLKKLGVFDGSPPPSPEKTGVVTEWFYAAPYGMPRQLNITETREYAKESWVQMVTQTISKEVSNIEWKVVPKDEEDETDYTEMIETATDFLNHPNRNGDSWQDIVKPLLRDILEIDAGVLVKAKGQDGKLKEIWARDGGTFLKEIDIHGILKRWWQYSWRAPATKPVVFDPDAIVYFMMNPATNRLYGWSPLMSIRQVVEVLTQATRWNKEFFRSGARPAGIVNADMPLDQLKALATAWKEAIQGKPHKLMFLNAKGMDYKNLSTSAKDMEFLKGQQWYMHLVFAVYGVSPAEAGFYDDVNRASMEGQERITVKNAIKPYLTLLEHKFTADILPDLFGLDTVPLKLKFFPKDHVQEKIEHDQQLADLKAGVISVNEIRTKRGLDPFDSEHADNPFKAKEEEAQNREERANQMQLIAQGQQGKPGTPPVKPTPVEKPKSHTKRKCTKCGNPTFESKCPICKSPTFGIKSLVIEEAKDYAGFLQSKFGEWEKQIIRAIEIENVSTKSKEYVKKSFGGFLSRMFNTITTTDFRDSIIKYVMKPMKVGLVEAENEVNVDIAVGEDFKKTAEFFADQQLNGYTVPEGKKWHGIQGATKELQVKIYKEVQEGVINKESQKQITDRVKDVFKSAKEGQAVRIARTETNRFINGGKLSGYIDSNVDGKKRWVSILDDKTSDECKRMNGQTRGLTDHFEDPITNTKYISPPRLPNCRSTMEFVFD